MMHPEDLLAAAIDGTLTDRERADLDAHIATCDRCREELRLAPRALDALAALAEVDAPAGLAEAVLAEAVLAEADRPEAEPPPDRGAVLDTGAIPWPPVRPSRRRPVAVWVAGFAAAAAIVGFFGLIVLQGGDSSPAGTAGTSVNENGAQAQTSAPLKGFAYVLLEPKANFTAAELQSLARGLATGARTTFASGGANAGTAVPTPSAPGLSPPSPTAGAGTGLAPATPGIEACIRQGAQIQPADRVAQVVEAKFNGTPAYIVALRQQTASGPTKVIVWVVAKEGCSLLSYTQATG